MLSRNLGRSRLEVNVDLSVSSRTNSKKDDCVTAAITYKVGGCRVENFRMIRIALVHKCISA